MLAVSLATQAKATISYQISKGWLETADVSFDGSSFNGMRADGIGITSSGSSGGSSSYVSICTDFGFDVASAAGAIALGWIDGLVNPTSGAYVAPPVDLLVPSPATAANGNNPDGAPPQELLVVSPTPQALAPTPVPEASTVITGTLLLLSFGLCSLKSFGKSRG